MVQSQTTIIGGTELIFCQGLWDCKRKRVIYYVFKEKKKILYSQHNLSDSATVDGAHAQLYKNVPTSILDTLQRFWWIASRINHSNKARIKLIIDFNDYVVWRMHTTNFRSRLRNGHSIGLLEKNNQPSYL